MQQRKHAMQYRIYRFNAVYCPSRDGVIGTKAEALPMTYRNSALAKKLALRLELQHSLYLSDEVWFEACPDGQPYHKGAMCAWTKPSCGEAEFPF
jgi:hypothetical protein